MNRSQMNTGKKEKKKSVNGFHPSKYLGFFFFFNFLFRFSFLQTEAKKLFKLKFK